MEAPTEESKRITNQSHNRENQQSCKIAISQHHQFLITNTNFSPPTSRSSRSSINRTANSQQNKDPKRSISGGCHCPGAILKATLTSENSGECMKYPISTLRGILRGERKQPCLQIIF
ncbi:unnamed protein product [Amaranthus hypochondriacus]